MYNTSSDRRSFSRLPVPYVAKMVYLVPGMFSCASVTGTLSVTRSIRNNATSARHAQKTTASLSGRSLLVVVAVTPSAYHCLLNPLVVHCCTETRISTLIPSNLCPKRDCSPKRDKYRFSSALYRNIYLILIPSNLCPQRDCSPKRVTYHFI